MKMYDTLMEWHALAQGQSELLPIVIIQSNGIKIWYVLTWLDNAVWSLKRPSFFSIAIGYCTIDVSPVVKDIGVQFDTHMKMYDHIQSTRKKAYLQIHIIGRIGKYISEATTKNLVQFNVISLLDYCNCLSSIYRLTK